MPVFATLVFLWSCKSDPPPPVRPAIPVIDRATWNRTAADLALPLFWAEDGDGKVSPEEVAVLWMGGAKRADFIEGGRFTTAFYEAAGKIAARTRRTHSHRSDGDERRLALVEKELGQGRPTLIATDFSRAPPEDKALATHLSNAALVIERLHAAQRGVLGMESRIPPDDTASRMLFFRNQGPWCEAPETERDPSCSALREMPKPISGLYPRSLQENDPKFCQTLAARKDGDRLLDPFHVVIEEKGSLAALPYSEVYRADMEAVAVELAAAALEVEAREVALRKYLEAAAKAFRTNQWEPADEAWATMNAGNSKWYLRVGPDEVYFEPCSRKAGFHLVFAKINPESKEWQAKLEPVKGEMENALAALAGKPYAARTVAFHLPDFIDIILNAGDSRRSLGATVGQSLPNWGPVANEGRGRTVAMTNIETDPDSVTELVKQASSVLCVETMKSFDPDPKALIMSTVLHEATHNLGPAHEYRVNGRTDDQIFGGPLSSTLEELKAETASYYFADWLAKKGIISREQSEIGHVRDVVWGFGHIARGMYDPDGKPKPYSHLSAIHLGYFIRDGAAEWKSDTAANGKDAGCLELHFEKLPASVEELMGIALGIKARGDVKAAERLITDFVESDPEILRVIQTRWLRSPRASFVYSVTL